jgi:Predicted AAA-ATPase
MLILWRSTFEVPAMKRILLPLRTEKFCELVTHRDSGGSPYLYIDQSEFIEEVWDNGAKKVTLINRPRRFRKTLNLSTLQHFFAPEVVSVSTERLFNKLRIARYAEIMKLQGQFPVIFLTLKDIRERNADETLEQLKIVVRQSYT